MTAYTGATRAEPNSLPPGEWVKRGLSKVYVRSGWDHHEWVWHTIEKNLRADSFTDDAPVTGDLCDDCGCLLAPDERCPSCLVWAIEAARQHEWQQQSFANRHVIWDILAARKEREEAA